jgi:hypothetical protein
MTIILTIILLILALVIGHAPDPHPAPEPMPAELAELLDESRWPEITPDLTREELREIMLGELDRIERLEQYVDGDLPREEWMDLDTEECRRLVKAGDMEGVLELLGR